MKKTIILRIDDEWERPDSLQECPLDLETFVQEVRDSESGLFKVIVEDRKFVGGLIELEGDLPEKSFDKLYGQIKEFDKVRTHLYWVEVIDA